MKTIHIRYRLRIKTIHIIYLPRNKKKNPSMRNTQSTHIHLLFVIISSLSSPPSWPCPPAAGRGPGHHLPARGRLPSALLAGRRSPDRGAVLPVAVLPVWAQEVHLHAPGQLVLAPDAHAGRGLAGAQEVHRLARARWGTGRRMLVLLTGLWAVISKPLSLH